MTHRPPAEHATHAPTDGADDGPVDARTRGPRRIRSYGRPPGMQGRTSRQGVDDDMATNITDVLSELIETLEDGRKGFAQGADKLADSNEPQRAQ